MLSSDARPDRPSSETPMQWTVRHVAPALRTYAGSPALGMLAKELARAGADRVVVVSNASILHHTEPLSRVHAALGDRLVATFGEAAEHSPIPVVERAAALIQDSAAQAIVVLGGGSAIVTARAATILAAEQKPAAELCTYRDESGKLVSPRLAAPKLPQWIIPSTPTTAYAKAGAAVRDPASGSRMALFDPKVRASGLFFDPSVAATAPSAVVRSSALNAFAMAVDGLQSGVDDPLAVASLRHALVVLQSWLPRIGSGDAGEAGIRLMFAALMAGQGSDHVGTGLAQPISHAAGPRSSVGNGVVEAMLLPHTMRFNVGTTDAALEEIASLLRPGVRPTPEGAVAAVEELLEASGVPPRLRDVGVDRELLPEITEHVAHDWSATTVPRPADQAALLELLERAW